MQGVLDRSCGAAANVAVSAPPITLIEPRHGWRAVNLRELWHGRELLYFLVWRDIKVRYKQTVIGAAWAVIQPLLTMVIFSIIFGTFAKLPSDGVPYPVFVYAGLLPWIFFSNAVTNASNSLVGQAHLLTKTYFPRLLLPLSSLGVATLDFTLSLVVYFGLMAWYGFMPTPAALLIPALLLLTAAVALGVGTFFAALMVVYRDFRVVVPFALQIWMYASPVVYPTGLAPERYRWLLALNPLTGVISAFRSALLARPADWPAIVTSMVLAALALVAGVALFRRTERRFADIA